MERNPFAPDHKDLPDALPVFPLLSAFLLPTGQLPLNIFEPRYLQMIEDALKTDRMIGMIQPADDSDKPALAKTGCAGKIIDFSESPDGRYLITLAGLYRFNVVGEMDTPKMYRIVQADWRPYESDQKAHRCLDLNRDELKDLLKTYFTGEGMDCDWAAVDDAPDGKLITCLSMVCPFEAKEKQALLEAPCCKTRADLFLGMLKMAVKTQEKSGGLDKPDSDWH